MKSEYNIWNLMSGDKVIVKIGNKEKKGVLKAVDSAPYRMFHAMRVKLSRTRSKHKVIWVSSDKVRKYYK